MDIVSQFSWGEFVMGRQASKAVLKEREDIVCRMRLEGWTAAQIAGYIGIGAWAVRGVIEKLKKSGRLPHSFQRGTKNPTIGVGHSGSGSVRGR